MVVVVVMQRATAVTKFGWEVGSMGWRLTKLRQNAVPSLSDTGCTVDATCPIARVARKANRPRGK